MSGYIIHYGVAGRSGRYKQGSQNNAGNKHFYKYINGIAYIVDDKGNAKRPSLNPDSYEEYNTGAGINKLVPSSPNVSTDEQMEIVNRNIESWEKTTGRHRNPDPEKARMDHTDEYIRNQQIAKDNSYSNTADSMRKITERDGNVSETARNKIVADQAKNWASYGFDNENDATVARINGKTATEYYKWVEDEKSVFEKAFDKVSDTVKDIGNDVLSFLGLAKPKLNTPERGQVPWQTYDTDKKGHKGQVNIYTGEHRIVEKDGQGTRKNTKKRWSFYNN